MQSRGKAIAEIARVGAIPVNQPLWIDESPHFREVRDEPVALFTDKDRRDGIETP